MLCLSAPAALAVTDAERQAAIAESDRALRSVQGGMKDFMEEPAFEEEVTGASWLEKSESDQEDEIVHSMAVLSQYGIVFGHRPEHYRDAVKATLDAYPDRAGKRLTDILGGILYDTEPESRPALDKITLKRSS